MSAGGAGFPDGVTPNRAARRAAERRGRKLAALGSSAVLVSSAAGVAVSLAASPAMAATTFIVDDSGDTGPTAADCTTPGGNDCSLRDAIAAANADAVEDVITFSVTGTITLGSDLTGITEAVDIQGPGSAALTVDANGFNAFYFTGVDTGTPSITGLTINDGDSNSRNSDNSGGSITVYESDADFTFDDVVVTSGYTEEDGGGLLCAEGAANITISNSTFSDNVAKYGGGGGTYFSCDNLTITNTSFTDNTAYGGAGGGLYFVGTDLMVTGSTFTGNQSGKPSGDGNGGAAMYIDDDNTTITNTTISGNHALGAGGAIRNGGGTLSLTDSTVNDNDSQYWGGGLYITGDQTTIERTTISGNHSDKNGGAAEVFGTDDVTILASTISNNTAAYDGGGLYFSDSSALLTVANTTIAGNTAHYNGGGIAANNGDLSLLQTTISGNTAEAGIGDGVYLAGYTAPPPVKPGLHGNGAAKRLAAQQAKFAKKLAAGDVKAGQVAPTAEVHAAEVDTVTITGTIVSANIGGDDVNAGSDGPAVPVTVNNSLFGGVGSLVSVTGGGNLLGVNNPGLGALADNGGPTQTMALLPGSPAIDMGPTTVPSFPGNDTDQRQAGFPRVINGRVDIGAFEAPLVVRFTG